MAKQQQNFLARIGQSARNLMTTPHYLPAPSTISNMIQMAQPTSALAYSTAVTTGQSDRPLYPEFDTASALREGFNSSHYVYGCVQILSKEMARPAWMLETQAKGKGKERQWEVVPDSDFEALMKRPNPFQSGLDLLERGAQHFFLTGNMLLLKVRPMTGRNRKPTELWNIQPDQIRPVPSRLNFLSHYEFTAPGLAPIPIDPDDIVHVMIANPMTPFWGASPLRAMSRLVDTEIDALNWWRWSIRNRAAKDGFISYKRMLTDTEYTTIKRQLIEQVVGPWNARLPLILSGGAEWTSSSSNAVDMDFIDLRKMTREEICGGYGVPPMLMGIMDHSTYNNMREARLSLWQDTLVGHLDKFGSCFDHQLLPDFAPDVRNSRTACDLSKIPALLAHLASMADPVDKFWAMGVSFNELNARFGLGFRPLPPEVGDVSWISSMVQTAESAIDVGAEEQPPFGTDWSEIQAIAEGKPTTAPPDMAGAPDAAPEDPTTGPGGPTKKPTGAVKPASGGKPGLGKRPPVPPGKAMLALRGALRGETLEDG